jgi:hypothetical protein
MYRRNADTKLRTTEREYAATGNRELLIPINRLRRQAGLPPHPDARIILANNLLLEEVPSFAQSLLTFLDVYDEIDIPMYMADMPEAGLREALMALTDEIQQLEWDRSACNRAVMDIQFGNELGEEYLNILSRYGVSPVRLGEAPELKEREILEEEDGARKIPLFSPEVIQQWSRVGFQDLLEQRAWILQIISRRALRIYRKLLTYGALPITEVVENTPEIVEGWYEHEIADLDESADKIEIAINEILDTTQGFGPSPEAIELFTPSWYRD